MKSPSSNRLLLALSIALLFLVAAAAFFLSPDIAGRMLSILKRDEVVASGGRIHVTLSAGNVDGAYYFDIAKNKLVASSPARNEVALLSVAAPTGDSYAYICTSENQVQSVCVFYPQTNNRTVITKSIEGSKRFVSWSRNGENVLYSAKMRDYPPEEDYDPANWGVFIAKADGSDDRQVATGSIAFFSPDGATVYYLQKDGLHGKILSSGEEALVWPIEGGVASRYMSVVVSPDGSKIAWSNPHPEKGGSFSLFSVISWHPFNMSRIERLIIPASQVVFSPDSSAVAFNTLPLEGDSSLKVYRFAGEPIQVLNLQTFNPKKIYLTDWRP